MVVTTPGLCSDASSRTLRDQLPAEYDHQPHHHQQPTGDVFGASLGEQDPFPRSGVSQPAKADRDCRPADIHVGYQGDRRDNEHVHQGDQRGAGNPMSAADAPATAAKNATKSSGITKPP
jgi:hypothetical protein